MTNIESGNSWKTRGQEFSLINVLRKDSQMPARTLVTIKEKLLH